MSRHWLTVEGEPFHEGGELYYDDREYSIRCSGVDPHCMGWEECQVCHPSFKGPCFAIGQPDDEAEEELWRTGEAHGLDHRKIDGRWMTEAGTCYVAHHDMLHEAARWLEPLAVGVHEVDFDVPDGTDLVLLLAGEPGVDMAGERRHDG